VKVGTIDNQAKLILVIFVLRANRTSRNDELANNSQEFSIFGDHNIKSRQRNNWFVHLETPLHFTIHGPMSVG